jgi:hypothetical protein
MIGSIINIWFEYSDGLEADVDLLRLIESTNGLFTGKTALKNFNKKNFFMREFNVTHESKGIANLVSILRNKTDYNIGLQENNVILIEKK